MTVLRILVFGLSLLSVFSVAAANGKDWPMVGGNPARSGAPTPLESPAGLPEHTLWQAWRHSPLVKWSVTKEGSFSAPVVADGIVHVASSSNRIWSFDTKTGNETGGHYAYFTVVGNPVVDAGFLYVGTASGHLLAESLDGRGSGWVFPTSELSRSESLRSPIAKDRLFGVIPQFRMGDTLYALGILEETRQARLLALDARNGFVRWAHDEPASQAFAGQLTPLVGAFPFLHWRIGAGHIITLDAATGDVVQAAQMQTPYWASSWDYSPFLFAGAHLMTACGYDQLCSFSLLEKAPTWVQPLREERLEALASDGTTLYAADSAGNLSAFEIQTGALRWVHRTYDDYGPQHSPEGGLLAARDYLVWTGYSTVAGYHRETGSLQWVFFPRLQGEGLECGLNMDIPQALSGETVFAVARWSACTTAAGQPVGAFSTLYALDLSDMREAESNQGLPVPGFMLACLALLAAALQRRHRLSS